MTNIHCLWMVENSQLDLLQHLNQLKVIRNALELGDYLANQCLEKDIREIVRARKQGLIVHRDEGSYKSDILWERRNYSTLRTAIAGAATGTEKRIAWCSDATPEEDQDRIPNEGLFCD
ncbi:hypothetical protein LTR62_001884 [Meristemomyces frigidus]|uniref:Uncharacterized protein n=1 Tax=Meristemomyces frigidus TaxID=1508187 RepID=A0AAN7T7V5_9PEZI|nr:hypothetical protein LTR62_001884 [Meristemomyces frigidus]